MKSLRDRIVSAPHAFDAEKATSVRSDMPRDLWTGAVGELLLGVAGSSPYLARLCLRHREWLEDVAATAPEEALGQLTDVLAWHPEDTRSFEALSVDLRRAKSRAALLIALCDLGGVWTLEEVTRALTKLADAAVTAGAKWLLAKELRQGRLGELELDAANDGASYLILAMGKMGAGELNYSSDIDLIALFDSTRFNADTVLDVRTRYIHVTRELVRLLSESTAEGYVFRVDLRLRPAPSTTPVCMAIEAAERYYESVGRTWERAAHIKARPLVDIAVGNDYLDALAPFIWRRHLDFAAIDDVHDLLRKIRAQQAKFTRSGLPGYDLKLGLGGIREIEFFAQTRQLIMGGRDAALRAPTTLGALQVLAEGGWIDESTQTTLSEDYRALRTAEHRLQMIEDAQTHSIPLQEDARARVAALSGMSLSDFESDLLQRLSRVHDLCEDFFGATEAAPSSGSTQYTTDVLASRGYDRPADAERLIARWHRGEIAATRSDRAQSLFATIQDHILERISGAARPDQALIQFDRFLGGLPAGVQVFSLFAANPQLLDLIIEICTAAPRLASYLSRHPQTLDALLDQEFWKPGPPLDVLNADLEQRLRGNTDYERVLDETRRWARERWFRTGVHVLRNLATPVEAGREFSEIAECYIGQLLPRVIDDFATRHGAPPGVGLTVLAMGKLGSNEMTAASDLDLIIIFDPGDVEMSGGPRPLQTGVYYRRLTQSLVAALTAPTAEGALYEVDMRLRPSGRSGPVAVSLAAFERYQMEEAWVWEHLALTRARTIAGPATLRSKVETIIASALAKRRNDPSVLTEAREMRNRLIEANRVERTDPWSLKLTAGGLMEIEFLAQVGVLLRGRPHPRRIDEMIADLSADGWLADTDAQVLEDTVHLQQALQQVERVALDGQISADTIGAELAQVLVRMSDVQDIEALQSKLSAAQSAAAAIATRLLES